MTQRIREGIKKIVKLAVKPTGYTIAKIKRRNVQEEKRITRENFFDLYFSKVDAANFFFIQIGANDGKTNDPLYPYVTKYRLSGIPIEPQLDVFKLLQETYKNYPMVKCVNAAIAGETGDQSFYVVKESIKTRENFSSVTGIATFNKDILRRTFKKKLPKGVSVDDYIEEIPVKALSFNDLLKEHKIKRVDMIQIDCEGYDYEILKMIDFDKFSPSIINFESSHLSDEDRKECESMLESKGYKWFRYGSDTCAYKI